MFKKILTLLFFMSVNVSVPYAQFDNTGTSVANFLKIGVEGEVRLWEERLPHSQMTRLLYIGIHQEYQGWRIAERYFLRPIGFMIWS